MALNSEQWHSGAKKRIAWAELGEEFKSNGTAWPRAVKQSNGVEEHRYAKARRSYEDICKCEAKKCHG